MRSMRNDLIRVALVTTDPEIVQNEVFWGPQERVTKFSKFTKLRETVTVFTGTSPCTRVVPLAGSHGQVFTKGHANSHLWHHDRVPLKGYVTIVVKGILCSTNPKVA